MSCLLPLIAGVCLLDPSNVEVRVDASRRIAGDFTYTADGHNFGGGNLFTGELSVIVETQGSFEWRYGVRHESLIDKRDSANRRAFVGFTWRPFR